MTWKPKTGEYRNRVNDLIEKRRSTAQGWTDYGKREQDKANAAAKAAEQEQERGWGLPALLGGGVGMMFGGPAGAAIGAGLGGGLGLLRSGKSRGGGVGGVMSSLFDPVGAVKPLLKNPMQALPMLGAFAPYMKGLGKGGDTSVFGTGSGGAGYGDQGFDLTDPSLDFGSMYGAGDYGSDVGGDLDLGGLDPSLDPSFDASTASMDTDLTSGGSGLDWLLEEDEED